MDLPLEILREASRTLWLASPFLLLGLALAGLVHVLMPQELIRRWLGRPGLGGVWRAALIGLPLPVCSCGVVPLAVEMRRRGAGQPASLSFLTTTPESSIDSILLTWALLGPSLAVARPMAALWTALLGGVLAVWLLRERDAPAVAVAATPAACCGNDDCGDVEPATRIEDRPAPLALLRRALRYGFGTLLDDIAFWLVLGVALAGIVGALIPADLVERGLGGGIVPMLLALAVGIPLYMCASASTPIAAALVLKGLSPGAALVFLLAGPATNLVTLVLLTKTFGRRFVQIYLFSVMVGALTAGLAFDALLRIWDWPMRGAFAATEPGAAIEIGGALCFVAMVVLLTASLWRGAARRGWRELVDGFVGWLPERADR